MRNTIICRGCFYTIADRVVKTVERILILLPLKKRLLIALFISVALHLALFLIAGSGRRTASYGASRMISVDLVASSKKQQAVADSNPSVFSATPKIDASPVIEPVSDSVLSFPAGSRYFLYQEVDKKAEFIYSAPIANSSFGFAPLDRIRVKVRVFISETGMVDSVTVLEIEPVTLNSKIFQDALMHSKFAPAEKDGKKVKSQKILEVKMGMEEGK